MARSCSLSAGVLALTPISAFRPRRWRGALLGRAATVKIEVLEPPSGRSRSTADFNEVRDVAAVEIRARRRTCAHPAVRCGHGLEERILNEQFLAATAPRLAAALVLA